MATKNKVVEIASGSVTLTVRQWEVFGAICAKGTAPKGSEKTVEALKEMGLVRVRSEVLTRMGRQVARCAAAVAS